VSEIFIARPVAGRVSYEGKAMSEQEKPAAWQCSMCGSLTFAKITYCHLHLQKSRIDPCAFCGVSLNPVPLYRLATDDRARVLCEAAKRLLDAYRTHITVDLGEASALDAALAAVNAHAQ
jgi:hypothetical protein